MEICYREAKTKTKIKKKKKTSPPSPENLKRKKHKALIVGLSVPKHLSLPTY